MMLSHLGAAREAAGSDTTVLWYVSYNPMSTMSVGSVLDVLRERKKLHKEGSIGVRMGREVLSLG